MTDHEPIAAQTHDHQLLGQPLRQSTLAPVFIGLKLLRRVGLVQYGFGLVAVLSGRLWIIPLALAAVAVMAVVAILSWWRFTFHLVGDELIVNRGVLQQQRTLIPLERVQSVSTDQQVLHRVLGLVRARIDTAGAADDELVIDAIDVKVADALRRVAATHAAQSVGDATSTATPAHVASPDDQPVVLRRSLGDLVKVALTRNPGPAIALPLALVFSAGELLDTVGIDLFDRASELTLVTGLAAGFFVCLLAAVIWILRTINRYYDLTLWRTPRGFRAASGLLVRSERASALSRVQMVRSSQNLLERRLSIATVRLPPASSIGTDDEGGGDTITLPGTTSAEYAALLDEIVAAADRPREATRGIGEPAATRWMIWNTVPIVLIAAGTSRLIGWYSALSLLAVVAIIPLAILTQRRWRWGLTSESLAISHGVLSTTAVHVALRKTQSVQLERGIFHRRNNLASVTISTAGGDVTIPHLALADAEALRDVALHRVETDQGSWM